MKTGVGNFWRLLCLVVLLTACGPTATPTPTILSSPLPPTLTATATLIPPTLTPTFTTTPIPSNTLLPTKTPTPLFVATVTLPRNGLVAFYPFNGNTDDQSGNGHHGQNYGAMFVPDRYGHPESAAHFDGQGYISIHSQYKLSLVDSFSIAVWIRPETPPENYQSDYFIVGKQDNNGYGWRVSYIMNFHITIDQRTGHPVSFIANVPQASPERGGMTENPIAMNAWSCQVITFDITARRLTLITDGLRDVGIQNIRLDLPVTVAPMYIGALDQGGAFIGEIDDLAIYNRALSPDEAAAICGAHLPNP
jgi:hypothetical protein